MKASSYLKYGTGEENKLNRTDKEAYRGSKQLGSIDVELGACSSSAAEPMGWISYSGRIQVTARNWADLWAWGP